ncbi:hypothetical protein [Nonomuraea rhizosphaerae]|uniref:hypothetical protein n=1 Tax=Nonomuraea rhizosphaerae TaxID=2665663 RepID=UPI001C5F28C1|nr:hypothetical protein [Nonomuraea rhizosphaerae]
MLVVLAIAALAILGCVVLVSLGRGGELTEFPPDVPPLDLPEPGQLTAVDFMALQLPVNLVGYHTQSVDETLRRAATAISARDTRIAVLEQRVSELLSSRLHARQEVYAAPGAGLRTEHAPPVAPVELSEDGDSVALLTQEHPDARPEVKPDETVYGASADPADPADTADPDVAERDVPETDAPGPDVPETDAARDAAQADAARDAAQADAAEAEAVAPETVAPEAPAPGEAPREEPAPEPEPEPEPVRAARGDDKDERK